MYKSFLEKHIGWFDDRKNTPGVLTSVLASDVQSLNGVSSEGLSVMLEVISSIVTGMVIGFYYCW